MENQFYIVFGVELSAQAVAENPRQSVNPRCYPRRLPLPVAKVSRPTQS